MQRVISAVSLGAVLVAAVARCSSASRPPEAVEPPVMNEDMDATMPTPVVDAGHDGPPDTGTMPDAPASCVGATADASDFAPMMCGGQCVNTDTDNGNCGGCGDVCGVTGTACNHGLCMCATPQVVCSNRCVDITKDQSNCGFCGHNCQGNPCTAGLCQASNIAQLFGTSVHISSIAVDSTTVYWTQGTGPSAGAYGKPFAGGSSVSFGGAKDPRGIGVDLTHVFWVDYGTGAVVYAPLLGGSPQALVPAVGDGGASPGPTAITSDPVNVYWVDSALGTVNQIPIQGGGPVVVLASNRLTPIALAVDASNVYWADYGSVGNDGSVNKVPIGTPNAITPLATGEQQPSGIAIDATTVYWTDRANPSGTVKSVPIAGGASNTIAQDQGAPMGVAVDAQYVYWTNYDDNTVIKAPIAGGMSYTLASGQNNPSAIAVDDKNVYWANQGSGYILKVAK